MKEGKPADRKEKKSKESIENLWIRINGIMRTHILFNIRERQKKIKQIMLKDMKGSILINRESKEDSNAQ